jgi:hypothetical protein
MDMPGSKYSEFLKILPNLMQICILASTQTRIMCIVYYTRSENRVMA